MIMFGELELPVSPVWSHRTRSTSHMWKPRIFAALMKRPSALLFLIFDVEMFARTPEISQI